MNDKPKQMYNVRFNVVQGKNILVQSNNAYEIDDIGLKIWEICDGKHTIEDIAKALTQEYAVEYDEAIEDSRAFIEELTLKGLLQ